MRRTTVIGTITALILLAAGSRSLHCQNIKGKEIVGLRIGGIYTTNSLKDNFGTGSEIELHFITGLGPWFGVGFALSSHNLGESKNQEKDIDLIGQNLRLDLQVYSMTASFAVMKHLTGRFDGLGEAGLGIYSINGVVQSGFYEGYITDNQLGFFGGLGAFFGLTRKLSIDVNFKLHYILSGGDQSHLIYFYTGNKSMMLYQFTLGLSYKT